MQIRKFLVRGLKYGHSDVTPWVVSDAAAGVAGVMPLIWKDDTAWSHSDAKHWPTASGTGSQTNRHVTQYARIHTARGRDNHSRYLIMTVVADPHVLFDAKFGNR